MTVNYSKFSDKLPPSKWFRFLTVPNPAHQPNRRGTTTVDSAVVRYIRSLKRRGCSKYYIQNSRLALRHFSRIGSRRITRLTEKDVKNVLARVYRKVQFNTYATYSRIFRLFFEFCKSRRLVRVNFVREFTLPYLRKVAFFTPQQLDIIFRALPRSELRDACLVMYHTGLKITELQSRLNPNMLWTGFVLKERVVLCHRHIIDVAVQRGRFHRHRVRAQFQMFRRRLDFDAKMMFFRNSWIVRHALAGTPPEIIQRQIGMKGLRSTIKKIERLTKVSKPISEEMTHGFRDYV